MADDIQTKKTNETKYIRRYSEKEMEVLLAEDLKSRCKMPPEFKDQDVKHHVTIDSRDGSTSPYKEYVVVVTIDHGAW